MQRPSLQQPHIVSHAGISQQRCALSLLQRAPKLLRALRQSVESNRTALRATEAGFEVGTQTTVDVLAAQRLLRVAETNYSRSRYDYMLNLLRLKQAAGNLTEADIMQIDSWLQQ